MYQRTDLRTLITLYDKVIMDLVLEISDLSDESLFIPLHPVTGTENYKTLQKLLTKVVARCYQSAATIYTIKGDGVSAPDIRPHNRIQDYVDDLRNVWLFTKDLFTEGPEDGVEKFAASLKMDTSWGHIYQQALEHAIVQVLRHKMLIENIRANELNNKLSSYAGN